MKSIIAFAIYLTMALQGGAPQAPSARTPAPAEKDRAKDAILFLRLINIAESQDWNRDRRYVDLRELLHSGQLEAAGKENFFDGWRPLRVNANSEAEPLAGYEIHFVLGNNGQGYSVSLREKPTSRMWFTDDRGIIYSGARIRGE